MKIAFNRRVRGENASSVAEHSSEILVPRRRPQRAFASPSPAVKRELGLARSIRQRAQNQDCFIKVCLFKS